MLPQFPARVLASPGNARLTWFALEYRAAMLEEILLAGSDYRETFAKLTLRPSGCVRPSGVRSGAIQDFQIIENTKAPQVGLEPTTLRLTAGSIRFCRVLPDCASSCFLALFRKTRMDLPLASICRKLL
jgi:hypothetical protein